MRAHDRRMKVIEVTVWVFIVAAVLVAVANITQAVLILRGTPEATIGPQGAIPTPGSTDVPCAIVTATRTPAPTILGRDLAFWQMLTPEGRAVLSVVTLIVSDEPRSYACPQAYEVGGPTPAVCAYYGGVYEGDTNTIGLWGEAAQANPDILRHEALHALDAAGGDGLASDNGFLKIAGELAPEAEALYNAGGGGWFRPNELFAMIPLVVCWDFGQLPTSVTAYYARWFVGAALRGEEER